MDDLIIKNANLIDGTGARARRADIAISDGKITEVAERIERDAVDRELVRQRLRVVVARARVMGLRSHREVAAGDQDEHDTGFSFDDQLAVVAAHGRLPGRQVRELVESPLRGSGPSGKSPICGSSTKPS